MSETLFRWDSQNRNGDGFDGLVYEPEDKPSGQETRQETLRRWDRLQDLPGAQRRDYLATVRGPYSQREWADEIDKAPGTVGTNVSNAKENLGED